MRKVFFFPFMRRCRVGVMGDSELDEIRVILFFLLFLLVV